MYHMVIIGVGAIIVVVALGYVAIHASHQHNYDIKRKQEISGSDLSSIQEFIGSCSDCDGKVSSINGYSLPCHHHIHYTCATNVKSKLHHCSDPNMICKICTGLRLANKMSRSHEGLRNRKKEAVECVNCGKEISEDPNVLKCGHKMHESCWERIEQTSTTCPGCMDEE